MDQLKEWRAQWNNGDTKFVSELLDLAEKKEQQLGMDDALWQEWCIRKRDAVRNSETLIYKIMDAYEATRNPFVLLEALEQINDTVVKPLQAEILRLHQWKGE